MTDPQPTPSQRRPRPPSPEYIGAALAVIILALLGSTVFARGAAVDLSSPGSSLPSPSAVTVPSTPTPPVDPAVVTLLRAVNDRLIAFSEGLVRELDRTTLRTNEVASLVRQVNTTVILGADAVTSLGGALAEDEPGGRLAALYRSIGDSASQTLRASLANDAEYRIGAGVLVKLIDEIPGLQAELDALALGPPATSAPSASASPPPPSAPPSPSAPPPSSAPPASASPTPVGSSAPPPTASGSPEPTPAPGEQIENGGFEAGVGQPWGLFIGPASSATLAPDDGAAAGVVAAKIDIGIGSPAYSGISLRQSGLQIEAGRQYSLTVWVRAEVPRDVRVRIASTAGASYLTRSAPVSATWSPLTFPFTAAISDAAAVLEIDLGRSDVTTWIDSVSFRPVS